MQEVSAIDLPTAKKESELQQELHDVVLTSTAMTADGDESNAGGAVSITSDTKGAEVAATMKDDADATKEEKTDDKRYIPPYKKPDAALTFPEKVRSRVVGLAPSVTVRVLSGLFSPRLCSFLFLFRFS
jgi:hypothetical protein